MGEDGVDIHDCDLGGKDGYKGVMGQAPPFNPIQAEVFSELEMAEGGGLLEPPSGFRL